MSVHLCYLRSTTFQSKVYKVKQKSDGKFISNKYEAVDLKKFDFASIKTASTPMETNKALIKDEEAEECMSKEVGTVRYLSLVVPLKKVGDEAVHKELGDRMERVATTASSLEAEQDNGSGPRCQDTILGDVDAQTSIQFLLLVYINAAKLMLGSVNAVRHMLMLPVQVPAAEESDGFAEIIDFLKASSVHYALTVNPIIYTSCIEQFWATAKVQMVNGVRQLQALVDKKRVILTESSIRSDLHLDDAEGTDCLPTATIFEEMARMSSTMASLIICLATNQKFNLSKYIFDAMGKTPLFDTMMVQASEEVGEDSDHLTDSAQIPIIDQPSTSSQPKHKQKSKRRQRKEAEVPQDETEHEETHVLDLEKAKDAQAKEIVALKKRVQRLERKGMSKTTDASKQGRSIEDIDADAEVTLVNETQERQDDDLMFDTGVLDTDEMHVEAKIDEKDEQSTKLDDSTAGEAVTTASVEGSTSPTTIEEITL
ncbi:hypothetical protein Tco_0609174, partial [Tanacetum coccineum]